MNSIDEIKDKIKALEISQKYIDDELQKLRIHCEALSQVKNELKNDSYYANKSTKKIATFFRERGYQIVKCSTQLPSDVPYQLAKQLWKCIDCARPLLKKLFDETEKFTYSIESLSTDDRTNLLNFCVSLQNQQWIAYSRSENTLSITPSIPKEFRNFFIGGWAEAVNRLLIFQTLTAYSQKVPISHKVFWNVVLKEINSNKNRDMELDIVMELNDYIYIFETKSGQVLNVDKWIDRTRLFTTSHCKFMTCCVEKNINPKIFSPYILLIFQSLQQQLTKLLEKDFPPPPIKNFETP